MNIDYPWPACDTPTEIVSNWLHDIIARKKPSETRSKVL